MQDSTTDKIKGTFHEAKGKVKEKWGKLTDDDLTAINGLLYFEASADGGASFNLYDTTKTGNITRTLLIASNVENGGVGGLTATYTPAKNDFNDDGGFAGVGCWCYLLRNAVVLKEPFHVLGKLGIWKLT